MKLYTPTYFPIDKGLYEVSIGVRPLGSNFNNPEYDSKIFHLTDQFDTYFINKKACLEERESKYICEYNLSDTRREKLIEFLIIQLPLEYPELFTISNHVLRAQLTNMEIDLKNPNRMELLNQLMMQVQEDIALVNLDLNDHSRSDYISYLHLCGPSHWAAEDKIGKNFFDVHSVIPGVEKLNAQADRIIEMMVTKGPFVRFIWSFVTDKRINHHPIPPEGIELDWWKGRSFNQAAKIPFYLRIERQVIYPLPEVKSSVFTIGVSFIDGDIVKENPIYREQLKSALMSMSPMAKEYKGVANCFTELINYLTI